MPKKSSCSSEFCWLTLVVIVAVICVIIANLFGIHIYPAITLGLIVLFALTLLIEKTKKNIVPLLFLWLIVILWVCSYAVCSCFCSVFRQ
jgi:hypothetical protein